MGRTQERFIQGGGKDSMKLSWNSHRGGGGAQTKTPSMEVEGMDLFCPNNALFICANLRD